MTDMHNTLERIKSANAVPSPDSFPSGALSSSDLLAQIDARSRTMTDTLTPIRPAEPVKAPRRGRGPLVALAVAAAIVLIIGTSFAIFSGGDAPPPATDPPPTTTTAASTLSRAEGALAADTPPLEVLTEWHAHVDAGDMARADAMVWPDSGYVTDDVSRGVSPEIWYRAATGVVMERDCTPGASGLAAELGIAPRAGGAIVTCNETMISGLQPGSVIGGGTFAAEVADGMILDIMILPDFVGALDETEGLDLYRNWVRDRRPEAFEELFAFGINLRADTTELRTAHQEMVAFFLSSTGPRAEGALPADTPLLDVVATFLDRSDSADIAGYEAIFHPLSGYESGSDAAASWFAVVTGVVAERHCELVSDIQVRCTEIHRSGLEPGTVSELTSVWNGADGYIWSIDFPDGLPPVLRNDASLPGLPAYRNWVRDNEPGSFDDLFSAGLFMRLDSEEARSAHTDLVARFLAATS